MVNLSFEFSQSDDSQMGFVGNIPVRNLWLLMLYASDIFRQLGDSRISLEENPDDIADLVAELLCHQVEKRLRRNLSFGYQKKIAIVSRVRGRIDSLYTESHRLLEKGKVCCKFDELTVDTPRNRYVRSALEILPNIISKPDLVHRCRSLVRMLDQAGVRQGKPISYSVLSERFGRNDSDDRKMLATAELAFNLALPTEMMGNVYLTSPDRQIAWLRRLFEKGIAGFYSVSLSKAGWVVGAGKQMYWQVDDKTAGIDKILPSMKTDIVLERAAERIIIDTKFNSVTTKGWHRDQTLRNGYIYQIYAYLRSQEKPTDPQSLCSTGMLLHPAIDVDIDEFVIIQGHKIRFCTVNLANSAANIRSQLLSYIADS